MRLSVCIPMMNMDSETREGRSNTAQEQAVCLLVETVAKDVLASMSFVSMLQSGALGRSRTVCLCTFASQPYQNKPIQ